MTISETAGAGAPAQRSSRGRLDGKVAVVTGGGSGIGRSVVDRYVAEGARVVVLERDAQGAEELATHGDRVRVVVGDVREHETHARVVEEAVRVFGRLDVHLGNAGVYDYNERIERMPPEELSAAFGEVMDTNVLGLLLGARAAIPELRRTGGTLIFTASSSSTFAGGGGALYVASKHAVAGLVKQLAHELAPEIRVNAVAPGATRTALSGVAPLDSGSRRLADETGLLGAIERTVPLGFVSEPEDHSGIYVMLADHRDSRFMTGVMIASDGGLGVGRRPRRGDRGGI
ncbi:3-(cis-5,6-dihydroxycyclohexa-1,3-dien-1-yl)propanoate dehydrogenase [Pimelobacter simplex]|uniref:3-(Cis-5,6-dihydroxycyclohexa-1, 3-dien-1-yl)propanoate dehydrogenase n=1 Tax=Nocardioides simplex TaxID=2045 RepID=A0A7J5DY56_NOCSI|nr:3-(cis-5,6-dihydroxycyclohexa-1,3-dien-1-yl)propanoate dehydrogenase [Pimelobacter simplex]KAB2810925.1 3-(cis-5,6-dihydroxycyclohexa-1,3-dien-1-yl)propanoate dehydrogenase [Pimelobacter simplex]